LNNTNILSPDFRTPCTSCSKRFKPSNLLSKVVHSIATENFYLIRVCKKCFDLKNIVCKHGKRQLKAEEVAWRCDCGVICIEAEDVEKHGKETKHNTGHPILKPKPNDTSDRKELE
jgi:hypothetical protein